MFVLIHSPYFSSTKCFVASSSSYEGFAARTVGISYSGQMIGNNPYLQQSVANAQSGVVDQLKQNTAALNSGAAAFGRSGSGAQAVQQNNLDNTAATAMSKIATDMYANQYNTDTQNMLAANNQVSNNYNSDFNNLLSGSQQLGNSYAQNANTQLSAAGAADGNYQNQVSNLSSLLGQLNSNYNSGVQNQLANAGLQQSAAQAANSASNASANTSLAAAGQAGNVYQNTVAPAETVGAVGAAQDTRAQQELDAKIQQWDYNQQMPLQQLANFANILNGGNYQTTSSTTSGNSALTNILGGLTGAVGLGTKLFALSDARFKENVKYLYTREDGVEWYSYNYIEQADALRSDITSGTGFDALKEARTRIGEIAFDRNAPAATRNMYGRLYGAITKDMEATAAQSGDEALSAWKRATNFSKRTKQDSGVVSNSSMQKLLKKDTPESLYRLISSGVKNNGTKVNDIMKQVRLGGGQDSVQEVFSTTINKLGVSKQGEFSPTRWLTDYDAWADEAKDAFFRHVRNGSALRREADSFRSAVKELAEYQNSIKAGSKDRTLAKAGMEWANNMLGDKTVGALAGVASGGSTLPVTAAVMGRNFLVSRASNKMFTNPETLKFLTRSVKGEPDKAVIAAMKKFTRTARDEMTKAILRQYLQSIGEAD